MFETQRVGSWFPEGLQRWKPFLFSLVVTPFAILVGMIDFGPEGPHLWIAYLIFPYAAFCWFLGAILGIGLIAYFGLLALLFQIPAYGLIFSLIGSTRRAVLLIIVTHALAILCTIILFLMLLMMNRKAQT